MKTDREVLELVLSSIPDEQEQAKYRKEFADKGIDTTQKFLKEYLMDYLLHPHKPIPNPSLAQMKQAWGDYIWSLAEPLLNMSEKDLLIELGKVSYLHETGQAPLGN